MGKTLCIFLYAAFLLGPPAAAAPEPARPQGREGRASLFYGLRAGPTLGMDRLLRGARAGAELGLARGGLSLALRAGASYDAELGCLFAEAGLSLGLGGELGLLVGAEIPLGSPELRSGGSSYSLRPAPWPCLFALSVPIARIAPGGGRRPALAAEAELSYSAYRVEPGAGAAAGLAGFSTGFRALLGLKLSSPRRGP
ncbi:MAG TPA: hypothetical protein P5142_06305 [Spirochaetia bacterium]|nr:hypothetical protein [Spirochaetia bacterium]